MRETETLIVGLGIAGLNLCHQLQKQGRSFLVIDNCPASSASLIAGGIYNPLALKRKIKSWKVDELFPFLVETYTEMEERLGGMFLRHDFPILKPVSSFDEMKEWRMAISEKRLIPYVQSLSETRPDGPFQDGVFGAVIISESGFVRLKELLLSYRIYLKDLGLSILDNFDHSLLKMNDCGISYKEISAKRVIFSEGRFISKNPYFDWVPFKHTKGQMLTVKVSPSLDANRIYNHQFMLFPTDQADVFRLGATYDWDVLDEVPTKQATDELLEKVKRSLKVELEVLEAQAAVRPTVIDRRPVIGQHPELKQLFLFNGMGTKGVMLAPYFAKNLVDNIYGETALDEEANLNRFIRKYYKKA